MTIDKNGVNVWERSSDVAVVEQALRLQASLPIGVDLPLLTIFDQPRDVIDGEDFVEVHFYK